MTRAHYTDSQLIRFYLQDLVTDIRCARRDGMPEYAAKCAAEFRKLWAKRHGARIDRYGMPVLSNLMGG